MGAQRLRPEQGKRGNTGRAVGAEIVDKLIGMEVGREGNKEKMRRGVVDNHRFAFLIGTRDQAREKVVTMDAVT